MKYTNYILHGHPVDFDEVGAWAIPAAVVAVPILTGFLGGAALMDGYRYIHLQYLLYQRGQQRINHIRYVLRSLDRPETKEMINLLKSA